MISPTDFNLVSEIQEETGAKEVWFSELHPIAEGTCIITMRLKNRPAVTQSIGITIGAADSHIYYLDGVDEVRLDRYATYSLIDEDNKELLVLAPDETVEFTVENKTTENTALGTLVDVYDSNNQLVPCAKVLHANAQNKIGEVILTANHKRVIDE